MRRRLLFYAAVSLAVALAGLGFLKARAPVEDADFRLHASWLGSLDPPTSGSSRYATLGHGLPQPLTLASSLPITIDGRALGAKLFGGPGPRSWQAAGILMSGELEGGPSDPPWLEHELEGINLAMGLRSLILRGRSDTALAFLDRLEPALGERFLGYRAWAAFELRGALTAAERVAIEGADLLDLSPPMARLALAMEWHNRGADVLIQDRLGHPIGALSLTVGELEFEASEEARDLGIGPWLPEFLLEAAPSVLDLDGTERKALRSSIDVGLSRRLQASLQGFRGTIVVLDVASGAVLAAVSDPTTAAEGGRAFFEDAREPASIAKLMTATAVLRAGYDIDERVRASPCHGAVRTMQGPLWCPSVLGRVDTFKRALAASCNTTFGRLGLELGEQAILEEYSRFGFERLPPLPVSKVEEAAIFERGRRPGARLRQSSFSELDLARLSVGLDHAELTPLFAARYARVFSDGRLVEPKWLEGEGDWLGLAPTRALENADRAARSYSQVVDPEWLPVLWEAMIAVTGPRGTAGSAVPRSLPTAMKTGTASEPAYGFHVNYVGIAPMPNPRFAFALRVDHQPTSRRVRRAARTVTRRMLTVLEQDLRRAESQLRFTALDTEAVVGSS